MKQVDEIIMENVYSDYVEIRVYENGSADLFEHIGNEVLSRPFPSAERAESYAYKLGYRY